MKRNLLAPSVLLLSSMAALLPISAVADAGMDLAKSKTCLACHTVTRKVVGPSFQDVAKKYAGNQAAEAALATKIRKGGAGVWGPVPMPANPQVSDAEALSLARWVLQQK
ncbi:c-type cytochrome [Xylophilus sp. Kf1]|nr:c-type cytochrome [Xylophilus sp. Kf1]